MNVRKNFSLAWPLALNALLVQSMVMVDVWLVAPLEEAAIAALGIATTITAFLIGIQFALASGTQLILARLVGQSTRQQQQFFMGLSINLGSAFVFSGLLHFVSPLFLQSLNLPFDVVKFAQHYLNVMAIVMLVSAVSQVIIVLFNAKGNTRIPLQGLLLEIPINMAVSYGCIYGIGWLPEFGVQGAALGSLAAVIVRCGYLWVRLKYNEPTLKWLNWPRPTRVGLREHLNDAWPIAANYITLSFGMMVFQLLFSKLPITDYAAVVLVLPWLRMGGQVSTSWAQATSIHISQMIGQNQHSAAVQFTKKIVPITLLTGVVLGLVYIGFGFGAHLIYAGQNPDTLAAIVLLIPIYVLLTFFRTINTNCGQALRAYGKSAYVLKVHASTQWFAALPLCALLLYLEVSVFWVFAMLLLDEMLKTIPFARKLKHILNAN